MANLEKEVAALNQENQELKHLLQKLDTEDIYAHRIYKQVKEKLDLENDNQQKFNNPLLTAFISIMVALSGNTAFFGIFQASKDEAVKAVKAEGEQKIKDVTTKVKKAATEAATEAATKTTQTIKNVVNEEVTAVKKEVTETIKEEFTVEINKVVDEKVNEEKIENIVETKLQEKSKSR
ncbi:hypothetical protein [Calothrix rhizosoleniae]